MTAIADRAQPVRDGRRAALRDATAEIHARLEALTASAGAFEDRRRYGAYLLASLSARAAVEAALKDAGAATVWPAFTSRCMASLMQQDAADLGLSASPDMPLQNFVLAGHAATLGALYVLEGSALGARMLVAQARALGLSEEFGARHLHAQAADRQIWRDFLCVLETARLDDAGDAEAAAAACEVFSVFAAAYAPLAHEQAV